MKKGLSFFVIGILVTTIIATSATMIYFYEIYEKSGKIFSRIGQISKNISNITFNENKYLYTYLNYISNCIIEENRNIVCKDCGKRIMLKNPLRTIEIITCLKEYNPPRKGYWRGCLIIFENGIEGVIDVGKRATLLLQECYEEGFPIPMIFLIPIGSHLLPLELENLENIICTNITYPVIVECSFENDTYYWKRIS